LEKETHYAAYYKLSTSSLSMSELGLVDYFVMGEAVGHFACVILLFKKANTKLSTDIETKVLSDLDDKSNELLG